MIVNLLFATLMFGGHAPAQPPEQEAVDFERDVRPILEASCFRCHGPHAKRIRGHLMMAGQESLLIGGDSGAAIVPGDPDQSLLIRMVRYEGEDFEMPPDEPLKPEMVDVLERWVSEGAVWPGGDEAPLNTREISIDEGRQWWAFRPVARPEVPETRESGLGEDARNAIDQFITARLEGVGLTPAPVADERILVRRLYVDLLGLQPTLAEVETYLADERADKWSHLIDDLLARPQYGERWGRYWLDVVRFAQTNGYEKDEEKPYIWRYRDYVIDAYNADKPYDQFLRQQLAGDELDPVTEEGLVATGFYSLGVWDTEPNDKTQAVWDAQDDTLRTITEGMLGVTVGCARCHDHRFDPIRQKDYYSLLAFLRNVQPYDKPSFNFESRTHRLPDASEDVRLAWERDRLAEFEKVELEADRVFHGYLEDYIEANFDKLVLLHPVEAGFKREEQTLEDLAAAFNVQDEQVTSRLSMEDRIAFHLLDQESKHLKNSYEGGLSWVMCASEVDSAPVSTHVLRRGLASSPLEQVEAEFLPVLCVDDAHVEPTIVPRLNAQDPQRSSSGQRLALANWIASPEHPTTARVMVNRIWQGHFGVGLVPTPNDFGSTGTAPTHPLLLDWLADEFVHQGWSVKQLHRLILNSATYRQASNWATPEAQLADPSNSLLWRQNMRRLDAEALHDSILGVCGELNLESGGRGFFPALSLEALGSASRPGSGWQKSSESERNRRAVYAYRKRGLPVPFLTVFDTPDPSSTQGKRASTTVANQALTLLNGELANRQAFALSQRLLQQHGDDLNELVRGVYAQVMRREPSPRELEIGTNFLQRQTGGFATLPARSTFRAAIPKRVEILFLHDLSAEDCLRGPREGWDYYKGWWGSEYNMTREALQDHGPFALLQDSEFTNARITFEMTLEEACENAGFLLRARAAGLVAVGTQVVFDVREQAVRLLKLGAKVGEPVELLSEPCALATATKHRVVIQLTGSIIKVFLNGRLCLEYPGAEAAGRLPVVRGRFGVMTTGEAMHLAKLEITNLQVQEVAKSIEAPPEYRGSPLERALALFCLTTLNLNEFLYVD